MYAGLPPDAVAVRVVYGPESNSVFDAVSVGMPSPVFTFIIKLVSITLTLLLFWLVT